MTKLFSVCSEEMETPDPIKIKKARKLLAGGFGKTPCEVLGAGVHGHAWMVEQEQQWNKQKGVVPLRGIVTP